MPVARHVFASADALSAELVRLTVEAAAAAIDARGAFHLALTGGSAATALYPVLAQAPLDWSHVHIWYGDERCVPPTDPESNHKLAHDTMLGRVAVPPANVHRIDGERPPHEAAAAYAEELERVVGGVLDVIHVGMGPDGHICSLFPNHPLLASDKLVDALTDSPKPPPARVTLALGALAKARALCLLVMGANKAGVVREAVLEPATRLPVALATRAHGNVTWLLDELAAKGLKNG